MSVENYSDQDYESDSLSSKFGKFSARISGFVKGAVKGVLSTAGLALGVGVVGAMALGSITFPPLLLGVTATALAVGNIIDEQRKVSQRYA